MAEEKKAKKDEGAASGGKDARREDTAKAAGTRGSGSAGSGAGKTGGKSAAKKAKAPGAGKKAPAKKPAKKTPKKSPGEDEDGEEGPDAAGAGEGPAEAVHKAKGRRKMGKEEGRLLRLRRKQKSRKPGFRRQEWFRYAKLGTSWRKPRGLHSKMRKNLKYRPAMARIGYGGPRKVKGLHPSGFEDVLVHNVRDVENLDPKTQAARIGHGVGTRKRIQMEKAAEKKGVRVLNKGGE